MKNLNNKVIEDLFYYNFTYEFDWNKSLFFISNKNKFSKRQTSEADTLEHSYKIKNL